MDVHQGVRNLLCSVVVFEAGIVTVQTPRLASEIDRGDVYRIEMAVTPPAERKRRYEENYAHGVMVTSTSFGSFFDTFSEVIVIPEMYF